MTISESIKSIADRINSSTDLVSTEEATKTSFILPFIQSLGYNVFDPRVVTPEFTADVGTKKGEKVDYAIMKDGDPIIIFECKTIGETLNIKHASQLFRYFHVSKSRFAVLTNGKHYQFYTDIEEPNKMDERPFFEFDITRTKDSDIAEIIKFSQNNFDVDRILATANKMKYTSVIKSAIAELMNEPTPELIRILCGELVANKRLTEQLVEQYQGLIKKAFNQIINENIENRLKAAISNGSYDDSEDDVDEEKTSKIVTNQSEIEGYHIIKSILRQSVGADRVFMRDSQSYCAILLDNNNRKAICRLHFNNEDRLVLGIGKDLEKHKLDSIDDIYKYSEQIIEHTNSIS